MTESVAQSVETALANARIRACPLCADQASSPVWFRATGSPVAVDYSTADLDSAGWRIVRCNSCGLLRVDPMPREKDLPALYDESYYNEGTLAGGIHSGGMSGHLEVYSSPGRRQASLRWHGKTVGHLTRHGDLDRTAAIRLLDVGCGAGYFLDAARQAGWDVQGVELSVASVQVGRQELGLNIIQGTLERADLPNDCFDVVTMFEVLEHMVAPGRALAEAHRILKPEGLLAIQVPNDVESYRNGLFGKDNRWWIIPPLHLYFFSAGTLTRWLNDTGFQVVYVGTNGGIGTDALTLMKSHGRRPGRLLTAGLRRLPAPLDWLIERMGRHTELTVYARKVR
ncbi:MAG: methyltransferase domain-containing protein [Chloroflexota bacterium]|nr:methyltransferase domain-containing protein [Chloroflexota bacterium]